MLLHLPLIVELSEEKNLSLNLNTYRNTHHYQLNAAKVLFGDEVAETVKRLPVMERVHMTYTLYPKTQRRCDVANVCSVVDKFFSDVLVSYGRLPDDNYEHLPEVIYRFGEVDKENPRVELLIVDLDNPEFFMNLTTPEEDDMKIVLPPEEVQRLVPDMTAIVKAHVLTMIVLPEGKILDVQMGTDGSATATIITGQTAQTVPMAETPAPVQTPVQRVAKTPAQVAAKPVAAPAPKAAPAPQATASQPFAGDDEDDEQDEVIEDVEEQEALQDEPALRDEEPMAPSEPAAEKPKEKKSIFSFGKDAK